MSKFKQIFKFLQVELSGTVQNNGQHTLCNYIYVQYVVSTELHEQLHVHV